MNAIAEKIFQNPSCPFIEMVDVEIWLNEHGIDVSLFNPFGLEPHPDAMKRLEQVLRRSKPRRRVCLERLPEEKNALRVRIYAAN